MNRNLKYRPDEDAPLLASWQQGDLVSFETLVWKYLKRIYNLSLILTGDSALASNATESAFVSSFREIGSLRSTTRYYSWLAGLAIMESRKLTDFKEVSNRTGIPKECISPHLANPALLPECLKQSIAALPQELKEVIVLHYVRGYSLERMEEILQVRTEILLSRLFEGQELLAEELKYGTDGNGLQLTPQESRPHPEIRRALVTYIDNAAERAEKIIIKKHLGGCGSCREALAELEWMVEHLKRIQDMEPPSGLTQEILRKISTDGPYRPERPASSFSPLIFRYALGISLLIVLGISWYIQNLKGGSSMGENPPAEEPKSGISAQVGKERGSNPPLPLPLSAPLTPTSQPPAPKPLQKAYPPAAAQDSFSQLQSKPVAPSGGLNQAAPVKNNGVELNPQLPLEWGEPVSGIPGTNVKAPLSRSRNGELAISIGTADPAGAVQAIEQAVIGLGGKITGRAYSSGNDLLYTKIEIERLFELMNRLKRVGKLLETPQLADDAAGEIDLVIRW